MRIRLKLLTAAAMAALPLVAPTLALGQPPGERSAVLTIDCDRTCLIDMTHRYLDAMLHKERSRAPFATAVRFTENDVEMPLGERGLWKSVTQVAPTGLELADPSTQNAAWFGTVQEKGQYAYFTVRIRVAHRQIVDVETLVDRRGKLPAPFGDPEKLVHDSAFSETLPVAQRRPRERLVSVANGYFSTVELNDGAVLTQFDSDCQRTENGISTTQGNFGAADIAQGCEAQFKLGIYRINKRVRERRYPLVDEERGIVLATGFFDHANSFDTYTTNDGKSHKTALKWPNSITLMEAFKIRDSRIYRVEAVFTYVPYFMHNPWVGAAQANALQPLEATDPTAASHASKSPASNVDPTCGSACLIAIADRYMSALVGHDQSGVAWADRVSFTENSVPMMVGDALWGSVSSLSANAVRTADPQTGNVAWIGTIAEHGEPVYYGMQLRIDHGRIADIHSVVARNRNADPFVDPLTHQQDPAFAQVLPPAQRLHRAQMLAKIADYYQNVKVGPHHLEQIDAACVRSENGVPTAAMACLPSALAGKSAGALQIRSAAYPLIDEERGIVVATGYLDTDPGDETTLPYSRSDGFIDAFKFSNGRIVRIESVSSNLPYFMH